MGGGGSSPDNKQPEEVTSRQKPHPHASPFYQAHFADEEIVPRGTTSGSLDCPIATTSCSIDWLPWEGLSVREYCHSCHPYLLHTGGRVRSDGVTAVPSSKWKSKLVEVNSPSPS